MNTYFSKLVLISTLLICCTLNVNAQSTIIYSNTTNFSGQGFANGGATVSAGNTQTKFVADDIFFDPSVPAGTQLNGFTFSVANFNGAAVSARPLVRFYGDNAGLPGVLLGGFNFNPISFAAGTVQLFSFSFAASPSLVTPAPGTRFWAGVAFDDNTGGTGATVAQLNLLGQGIFAPPTVGSSNDQFFQSTSAGTYNANNPPGSLLFFGGNPVADFGWSFTGAVAVPEPMTWAMISFGAIGSISYGIRYRRKLRTQFDEKFSINKTPT